MAASTWPSRVVGTCTTSTPRWYTAAANPATSVTIPPPTATTASWRVIPHWDQARHSSSTAASVLVSSPRPIRKVRCSTPGSTATSMPAWLTTATRRARDGTDWARASTAPGPTSTS